MQLVLSSYGLAICYLWHVYKEKIQCSDLLNHEYNIFFNIPKYNCATLFKGNGFCCLISTSI